MSESKLTDSEQFSRSLVGAAAHEIGHVLYAFSTGMQEAQVDFQIKKIADGKGLERRARTYRREYNLSSDTAASGFAGTIAEALILTPDATPDQIYAQATNALGISETDHQSIETLPEPYRRIVFDRTLLLMRNLLPFIREQTDQITARVKEAVDAGEESIGFLYRNPEPIPARVPIRRSLF